jgi:hypothetical protein
MVLPAANHLQGTSHYFMSEQSHWVKPRACSRFFVPWPLGPLRRRLTTAASIISGRISIVLDDHERRPGRLASAVRGIHHNRAYPRPVPRELYRRCPGVMRCSRCSGSRLSLRAGGRSPINLAWPAARPAERRSRVRIVASGAFGAHLIPEVSGFWTPLSAFFELTLVESERQAIGVCASGGPATRVAECLPAGWSQGNCRGWTYLS